MNPKRRLLVVVGLVLSMPLSLVAVSKAGIINAQTSTIVAMRGLAAAMLATTRYVRADASPGGNGNSWNTAYNTVQGALSVATAGDQIWVKKGTYFPTNATTPISLVSGAELYGGFVGTELTLTPDPAIEKGTQLIVFVSFAGRGGAMCVTSVRRQSAALRNSGRRATARLST